MKNIALAILAVAAILTPIGARADVSSDATMQQAQQKFQQLHQQARQAALAALTPAHRSLLAQVVGQLAIAPNPDMLGAARTIDSALSPAESQAILRISASLRAQARQMMQNEHAQMPGGQANVAGEAHHRAMEAGMHKSWSNDPAFVLFHIVMPGPGRGEAMH